MGDGAEERVLDVAWWVFEAVLWTVVVGLRMLLLLLLVLLRYVLLLLLALLAVLFLLLLRGWGWRDRVWLFVWRRRGCSFPIYKRWRSLVLRYYAWYLGVVVS